MTRSAQADLASQAEPLATDPQPRARDYEAKPGYQQQLTDVRPHANTSANQYKNSRRKSKTGGAQADLASPAEPLATAPRPRARDYEAKSQQEIDEDSVCSSPILLRTIVSTGIGRSERPRSSLRRRLAEEEPRHTKKTVASGTQAPRGILERSLSRHQVSD